MRPTSRYRETHPARIIVLAIGLLVALTGTAPAQQTDNANERSPAPPAGVCPPFHLRDEEGLVINPVTGENADRPCSPKMTCGQCHDYEKITQGYHFTQGMGEPPTADQAARLGWASTPGNFGGSWCSSRSRPGTPPHAPRTPCWTSPSSCCWPARS